MLFIYLSVKAPSTTSTFSVLYTCNATNHRSLDKLYKEQTCVGKHNVLFHTCSHYYSVIYCIGASRIYILYLCLEVFLIIFKYWREMATPKTPRSDEDEAVSKRVRFGKYRLLHRYNVNLLWLILVQGRYILYAWTGKHCPSDITHTY